MIFFWLFVCVCVNLLIEQNVIVILTLVVLLVYVTSLIIAVYWFLICTHHEVSNIVFLHIHLQCQRFWKGINRCDLVESPLDHYHTPFHTKVYTDAFSFFKSDYCAYIVQYKLVLLCIVVMCALVHTIGIFSRCS